MRYFGQQDVTICCEFFDYKPQFENERSGITWAVRWISRCL